MKSFMMLTLLMMLFGFGCGESTFTNKDDELIDESDSAGKADGIMRPVGTFRGSNHVIFSVLALKNDGTYYSEQLMACMSGMGDGCAPIVVKGTYNYSKAGTTRYLRLFPFAQSTAVRYAYEYKDDTLQLRNPKGTDPNKWYSYQIDFDSAWCEDINDCETQELPTPRCMCELACQDGTCNWVENQIKTDPVPPKCDGVGSKGEGWYDGETGELICWANCDGAEVSCGEQGTRSEGWYTDEGKGCMTSTLIQWASCSN